MILLFDIGNTHTHVGLGNAGRVCRQIDIPTSSWKRGDAAKQVLRWLGRSPVEGCCVCSVVPKVTPWVVRFAKKSFGTTPLILNHESLSGVGIRYPKPHTIGPDRLANALAVKIHFGAPALVVDFGTAVTFDVVDQRGDYVGGIIAPGLAAMTDYLHEKTALLPRIRIRDTRAVIGKNTEQAMLIGAVLGYRGLVRGLVLALKKELGQRSIPVVATGGYARLMAEGLPEITAVMPLLTLEGLRILWKRQFAKATK